LVLLLLHCLLSRSGCALLCGVYFWIIDSFCSNNNSYVSLYFFWAGELFITHTCNERNHNCQIEAVRSLSCKLPSQLGKRQTQKPAKGQHVKQNKPYAQQLLCLVVMACVPILGLAALMHFRSLSCVCTMFSTHELWAVGTRLSVSLSG